MKFEIFYLSDIYEVSSGLSKSAKEFGKGGSPFVSFKTIFYNYFLPDKLPDVANSTDKEQEKCSVMAGDVFLTRTSETVHELGMSSVALKDYPNATFNGFSKRLRLKCDAKIQPYPKYVGYFLRSASFRNQINSMSTLSTRASLNAEMIKRLWISIPSYEMQVKIGDFLFLLDRKIETNNAINRNLSEQAQALFKAWFIDAAEASSWETGTFSDLVISTLGGDWGKETETGNYTEQVYCVRGADIPEVNAGNKGKMPTRYILPKNFKSKQLMAGDIVVEISGGSPTQSTGRVASISQSLLDRYDKGMVCTNFCRAIKPKPGYSMFIYYYWKYLYDKGVFFLYENGTTGIKNLNINGFLGSEQIVLPPKELVDRFDNFCQSVFDQIFKNGLTNEKLAETRDTLLPRLMSGELDVSALPL